jgi:hypothetical protein
MVPSKSKSRPWNEWVSNGAEKEFSISLPIASLAIRSLGESSDSERSRYCSRGGYSNISILA